MEYSNDPRTIAGTKNMKILLLTDHSNNNLNIAKLTYQNHWQYSAQNGYDFMVLRKDWKEVLDSNFSDAIQLLPMYDCIMTVGSDVVFTNFDITVEGVLKPEDSVVMAMEHPGTSTVNLGVMLIRNTPQSFEFMRTIDSNQKEWLHMRLISQDWVNKHLELPAIKNALRVVPRRVMNSTIQGGDEWQEGDWLIHFCGLRQQDKEGWMRHFLARQSINKIIKEST